MAIEYTKIKEFLAKVEGKQQTQGYIPCNLTTGGTANYKGGANPERYLPMGVSGVTVATGVDLGQTDAATLKRLRIESGVINSLVPYLGQRGKNAVTVLHKIPLSISKEVADMLDTAMIKHHAELISKRYDKDAGVGKFESLPWQAQTAIFSILYQRGTGSPTKFKNTWKAMIAQDWNDAATRLCTPSYWDGYQSRRKLEGLLLKEIA